MITEETKGLLAELEECVAKGHPYYTTNTPRKTLSALINLIRSQDKELEQAQKVNDDYLCIMSYQRKLLNEDGIGNGKAPVEVQYTKLLLEGKVPETKPYSEYQQKTAEFLAKGKT